ncbi:MAG: hypothetical protein A3C82_02160 [Candidatus Wildermuthbacteria bacterium RIFCSPHIGHO2_02_FULL_47_12]|uniref:VOC domain-containing protein n=1 Tax=Candidatus Wildermuthbacteria bacterium RIFCSPHIGHO2_02_FULL_47_12 TaxID=1802451 RepID=A0A1G2R198_9BACT|nr:MAG: hypothetical protein A3C82_02160 [Candidatus Wildermuthbacteria bacterium RIFCSPHIGHO2_02_FULL_47_12]
MESKDPAGHIKISVSDPEKGKRFYARLFDFLGYAKIADWGNGVAYKSSLGFGIWIAKAEQGGPKHVHDAPGLHHFCLKAVSKTQVDQLYEILVKEGVDIFSAPRYYPEYTPQYYAVFFVDSDGTELELAYY